jgi:phage terminase Nu1 subunit (DNA packaging protein)
MFKEHLKIQRDNPHMTKEEVDELTEDIAL